MKLGMYEQLLRINRGYDLVIQGLTALRKYGVFHHGELAPLRSLSKETRAATNSYLVGAIEASETNEAGQRFRKRKAQERSLFPWHSNPSARILGESSVPENHA